MTPTDIQKQYEHYGYVLIPGAVDEAALSEVQPVLERFHQRWLKDNAEFYAERAVNSAYLTGTKYLDDTDRLTLFKLIGSAAISDILKSIISSDIMFGGTQLFFDPANPEQKNYWHRDIQYNDDTIEQQQEFISSGYPLHLRIALTSERGVELVPGTHRRWDTDLEFAVRMARDHHNVYDDLPEGKAISMKRGDLLVFSAAMIHRGLYGGNRFAFDLLFGDANDQLARHFDEDCLPTAEQCAAIECPEPFEVTRRLKQQ